MAWAVAALRKILMEMKEGSFFSCSTVIPNSVGSSPSTISALMRPSATLAAIASRFAPVLPSNPRIIFAPFVFGLRSWLSKMSSPSPFLGTISMNETFNCWARRAVSQSSSFVIRPEATMAMSQPVKYRNCNAVWDMTVFQSAGCNLSPEKISGSSSRSGLVRYSKLSRP